MIAPTSRSSRARERVAQLREGRRAEGVAALRAVDRDPGDPVALLVEDVLVAVVGALPLDRGVEQRPRRARPCVARAYRRREPTIGGPCTAGTDWLERAAGRHPERLAVADPHERLSYEELLARAGAVASALVDGGRPRRSRGDRPGARRRHVVALHGAILAGAVTQSMPARALRGRRRTGVTFVDGGFLAEPRGALRCPRRAGRLR